MSARHLLDEAPHRRVLCGSPKWNDATSTVHLATCRRCLEVHTRQVQREFRASVTTRAEIPRKPGGGR